MKLLLLIFFLSFHSGSFAGNDLLVEKGVTFSSGLENKKDLQQENKDVASALSTASLQVKHYKNLPQNRQHNFVKVFFTGQPLKYFITYFDAPLFVASYSYCKPIALFLIFPKHYFW